MAGFDITGARQAGYSDAEIVSHLSTDDSSKFDFKAAEKAGYSPTEIVEHLGAKENASTGATGLVNALKHGAASIPGGIGKTFEQTVGKGEVSEALKSGATKLNPGNYEPVGSIIDAPAKDEAKTLGIGHNLLARINWSKIPRAVAEGAAPLATDVVAQRALSRVAGPLGGAASYALRNYGQNAEDAADARGGAPGTEVTTADRIRAVGTTASQALLQTLPVNRLVGKSVPAAANVGMAGAIESGKNLLKTAGIAGATGVAQDAVGQVGNTVGTDGGTKYNPEQGISTGITGAATAGLMASPRALRDATRAGELSKFSEHSKEDLAATANRLIENAKTAEGKDGDLTNSKVQFHAIEQAESNIKSELAAATKNLTVPLNEEATGALKRASEGATLSAKELKTITEATKADPNGASVASLAHQATALGKVKTLGHFDTTSEKFIGGTAHYAAGKIRALSNPIGYLTAGALGASGLAAGAGAAMAYGPQALAALPALGGAYGVARMVDRFTGKRAPGDMFAKRFADPSVPVRPAAPVAAPAAPGAPRPGPTGPAVPLQSVQPMPWGRELLPETPKPQTAQQAFTQAAPALRQLANTEGPRPYQQQSLQLLRQLAEREGPNSPGQQTLEKSPLLLQKLAAQNAPPLAPALPPEPKQPDPIAASKRLMAGLQRMQKVKAAGEGNNVAERLASESPVIQEAGGVRAVGDKNVTSRINQLLAGVNAQKRLAGESEDATVAATPAESVSAPLPPVVASVSKLNGVTSTKPLAPYTPAVRGPGGKFVSNKPKPPGAEAPRVEEPAAAKTNGHAAEEPTQRAEDTSRYGMEHHEVAHAAFKEGVEKGEVNPKNETGYKRAVIYNRNLREKAMLSAANQMSSKADRNRLAEDHQRIQNASTRSMAVSRIAELSSKLTPEGAAVLSKHLTKELVEKTWNATK